MKIILNLALSFFILSLGSCSSTEPKGSANELSIGDFVYQKTLEPLTGFKIYHYSGQKSGMQVYLIQTPGSGVLTPVTAYGVGSRNEVGDRTGLAHLFEHMMFRGTPSFPAPFKTLSDWGGNFNAYTSFDVTNYFQTVPKHLMDDVFKFEAERMRFLQITRDGYNTERQAVISERKLNYEDNPMGRLRFELYQLAYDRHPYKTTPIGWQEDLDATSFEEALAFYKRYYAPNRANMVVVGDFEIPEVLKSIQKHYGSFKAEPWVEAKIPQEKARIALRRKVIPAKAENVILVDAVLGLRFDDERVAAESLLCDLLADSDHGYLSKELVQKNYATRVSANCDAGIDPQLSTLSVSAAPGVSISKIEGLYLKALQSFPSWLTEEKVQRMKNYYLANQYSSLRNPSELGKEIAHLVSATGDAEYSFKLVKSIQKLTRADILKRFQERKRYHPTRLFIEPSEKQSPLLRNKK